MRRTNLSRMLVLAASGGLLLGTGCNNDEAQAQEAQPRAGSAQAGAPATTGGDNASGDVSQRPLPAGPDDVGGNEAIGGTPSIIQRDEERVLRQPPGFRNTPDTAPLDGRPPVDANGDGFIDDFERGSQIQEDPAREQGLIDDEIIGGTGIAPQPVIIIDSEAQRQREAAQRQQQRDQGTYFAPLEPRGPQVSEAYRASQQAERADRRTRAASPQRALSQLDERIDRIDSLIATADAADKPRLRDAKRKLIQHYRGAREAEGAAREHLDAADRTWERALDVFEGT